MELEWVRLFLEGKGFQTQWKGETSGKKSRIGLSVLMFSRVRHGERQIAQTDDKPLPFYLFTRDLEALHEGIILLCGWQKWVKRPAKLKNAGDYYRLVEGNLSSSEVWEDAIVPHGLPRLLVLPGIPVVEPWRTRMKEYLEKRGIHGILSLRTILFDLQQQLEQNPRLSEPHSPSALDLLRLLRFYDLLKEPQMELFS